MKATLFLVITTVLWGLNYHWSKYMVNETSAFESALWRYLLAVSTLFLLNIRSLPTFKEFKSNFKGIFMVGFVGLFLFNFFFFQGMKLTSSINAVLIIALNPALTLVLSAILSKSSISIKQIVGIFLALMGVMILLFKGNYNEFLSFHFSKGDLLVMISSIFFALHHVWVKKYSQNMDNSNFTFLCAVMCLIPLILLNLFFTDFGNIVEYSSVFWMGAVGIGCLGTGIAYWFWYKGVEMTNAPRAAIFINIVPLSGSVFAMILGDKIYSYHYLSAFLIFLGILTMQIKFFKKVV